ncbi:unnamed protein product [Rhodiola kirilowii]
MAPPLLSYADHEPMSSGRDKRKISNRESARRARLKKQMHLHDVLREIDSFKRQKSEIVAKVAEMEWKRGQMEAEIDAVNAEKVRLERELSRLMELVKFVEASKVAMSGNQHDDDDDDGDDDETMLMLIPAQTTSSSWLFGGVRVLSETNLVNEMR